MSNKIPPDKRKFLPKTSNQQLCTLKPIKHICGHNIDISLIKIKNCPACDKLFKQKRKEKKKKQLEDNKKLGIKGGGVSWKKKAIEDIDRLPIGSKYMNLRFNENGNWSGELHIPYTNGDVVIFQGSSVFGLYALESELKDQYLKWAEEQKKLYMESIDMTLKKVDDLTEKVKNETIRLNSRQ